MKDESNNSNESINESATSSWPPAWLATPSPAITPSAVSSSAIVPSAASMPAGSPALSMAASSVPPANFDELLGHMRVAPAAEAIAERQIDFRMWRQDDGKVFEGPFAFDIETTKIVAHEVPEYILGAAADSQRGFYVSPAMVR